MMKGPGFYLKQLGKMYLHSTYLPHIYKKYCKNSTVNYNKVIFADAHTSRLTSNMYALYKRLKADGYDIQNMCVDFSTLSMGQLFKYLKTFMKEYSTARYVFISSYFLPVSSCEKRKETKVIELWHAGGMLKKMGYDATDDIPKYYKGNPTKNFDLVTVSADLCVPTYEKAFRLPKGVAVATGIARTDLYFDEQFNKKNIDRFYQLYPGAIGKKICVYAPSFSGNAAKPVTVGFTHELLEMFSRHSDEWFFITKLHPNMEKQYPAFISDIHTEELFAPSDLLITDYSSILFDYMLYSKPFILYAPDISAYSRNRGFYIDISTLPAPVVKNVSSLEKLLMSDAWKRDPEDIKKCAAIYMKSCDGHAVDRIINVMGIEE